MDDKDGNGEGSGVPGNPYVSGTLCAAYRGHIETKIDTMEAKILSSIKLTGAIIAIVVTIVQLGLHFFGG